MKKKKTENFNISLKLNLMRKKIMKKKELVAIVLGNES